MSTRCVNKLVAGRVQQLIYGIELRTFGESGTKCGVDQIMVNDVDPLCGQDDVSRRQNQQPSEVSHLLVMGPLRAIAVCSDIPEIFACRPLNMSFVTGHAHRIARLEETHDGVNCGTTSPLSIFPLSADPQIQPCEDRRYCGGDR
jgi:hypothetical protein